MTLEDQVARARKEIRSDGYEMSVGEISNLYRDGEIKIDPEYQRLFRWDITRKTRFIESLLLGIPIPPVFVYQGKDNVWELIDGLQRLSTVFQMMGILKGERAAELGELVLEGTNYLPALSGKRWEASDEGAGDGIGSSLQIQIKRSRIRVEILQPESDASAKFELFQRLNTGGASLTEQEIRNCVAVMIDRDFFNWLRTLASMPEFIEATAQTETALDAQMGVELALRIIAFSEVPYEQRLDVHEYLDKSLINLAESNVLNKAEVARRFQSTFRLLARSLGAASFKRWDGNEFRGKFLMSVFEVVGFGAYQNIDLIEALGTPTAEEFVREKAKNLWQNQTFQTNSGGGTRGTTRLANLLPMAREFMRP